MHHRAGIRRIRDDAIGRAKMVERKRILTAADVATIDALQSELFKMPDQVALASARLGKGPDVVQVRNQRDHRSPWCWVEVGLAALEVGSLPINTALRTA